MFTPLTAPFRGAEGGTLRALDSGGLISVRPQKADYSTPNRSLQKEANPAPSAGSKVSFQEALNPYPRSSPSRSTPESGNEPDQLRGSRHSSFLRKAPINRQRSSKTNRRLRC